MTEQKICDICGEPYEQRRMFSQNIGRKIKWLCPKCYLAGQYEVGQREHDKGTKRIRKEEKGRFK